MRVKRYVVDSMPDALHRIRTELGKDAVILNTKEVKSGGFMGMFSKKRIEVIAATDSEAAAPSRTIPPAAKPPTHAESVQPSFGTIQQNAHAAYARPAAASVHPASTMDRQDASVFPEVPDFLVQGGPAHTQARESNSTNAKAKEDILLDELKQMKEYMHKLSVQGLQQTALHPVLEAFRERLLAQELDAALAEDIILAVAEQTQDSDIPLTEEHVEQSLRSQLSKLFHTGGSKRLDRDANIVHFVGPTGVGKTTTIAKLAAEQVLKHQRKVGFITSDTYRIAAVEQLKTYATILNVPLEVVFSPQDLPKAFEQLKDCDLIFMDTAGRNYRNEMYVSELNALLHTGGKSETYLVLSLTTKYKDMKVIAENFSKFKLDKVLFTKMDETNSYGAIINLVNDFKLQLSYVTHGQNVPDDISELHEQYIIDLILGAHNHE
ncbi:flagellar biosynthesis protein FlhF [Paenibacillus xerothermodurans]|uniref:Flagellar biosynthesis protein FlhF n=1 Tax=Paenibacillus xerothermodurans TaxID=1977292 RepID=A0A2W1NXJ1_PAEXE|nr:flagellar biosynthesis protein FlhF [Paenibacillus xerothermodurans]PZE22436.1 flagellar biosynthesis protein FlhF [Paenibacillus xerothermodurans]